MYLLRESERHNQRMGTGNKHEHRSDNPVVERCRQRRVLHEHQSRLEANLREKPYRTQIQYHAAAQWEDNQLDDNKSGDLFQLPVSLILLRVERGRE